MRSASTSGPSGLLFSRLLFYTGFDMFMSISTNETTKALSLKILKDMKRYRFTQKECDSSQYILLSDYV